MGHLIAFDSGENTGWAHFQDRVLIKCGITHPAMYPEDIVTRIGLPEKPPTVVIECPQVYRQSLQKGDPNDLIKLATKVGEIGMAYRMVYYLRGVDFHYEKPLPRDWKGQVPKSIHHNRELKKLSEEERRAMVQDLKRVPMGAWGDVKDAVCLGLWRLGR